MFPQQNPVCFDNSIFFKFLLFARLYYFGKSNYVFCTNLVWLAKCLRYHFVTKANISSLILICLAIQNRPLNKTRN